MMRFAIGGGKLSVPGLVSFGIAAVVFTGAFTGTWSESTGPDLVPIAEARNACNTGCESNAEVCVKKCMTDAKPCFDKCNIPPDQNGKRLNQKDQACMKACFVRSQPCQEACQTRRAACDHTCPN